MYCPGGQLKTNSNLCVKFRFAGAHQGCLRGRRKFGRRQDGIIRSRPPGGKLSMLFSDHCGEEVKCGLNMSGRSAYGLINILTASSPMEQGLSRLVIKDGGYHLGVSEMTSLDCEMVFICVSHFPDPLMRSLSLSIRWLFEFLSHTKIPLPSSPGCCSNVPRVHLSMWPCTVLVQYQ